LEAGTGALGAPVAFAFAPFALPGAATVGDFVDAAFCPFFPFCALTSFSGGFGRTRRIGGTIASERDPVAAGARDEGASAAGIVGAGGRTVGD